MRLGEVVLGKFQNDGEESEKFEDNVGVDMSRKVLNFRFVGVNNRRMRTLKRGNKLGYVIDLCVIKYAWSDFLWTAKSVKFR